MDITPSDSYDRTGHDNLRFMFSANKSQPMQELSAVASGGEIARVMLSVKSLIAGVRTLPTVIFDEIDTGVSGAVAEKMAMLMKPICLRLPRWVPPTTRFIRLMTTMPPIPASPY